MLICDLPECLDFSDSSFSFPRVFSGPPHLIRELLRVYDHGCTCHSVAKLCLTLRNPMDCSIQASLSFTISQSLLKLTSIELVMPSNHLILCRSLLLLPSIFPSIRVFSNELALRIRGWSTGVSASASVLPMNIQGWFSLGLTGLISLQYKGLSRVFTSTTIWKHQFFCVQPSLWSISHIHTWLLKKP